MHRMHWYFLLASMYAASACPAVGRAHQNNTSFDTSDALFHPTRVIARDGRADLVASYKPKPLIELPFIEQHKVDWKSPIMCVDDGDGQQSAHFALQVGSVDEQNRVGVVLYLASAAARADGTYDVRIEIEQQKPHATIRAYTSNGVSIEGPVPLAVNEGVSGKKPLLPWQEGMKQFYSVVLCRVSGAPHLLLIQHTREMIIDYAHTSPVVEDIINRYARHERLQNRPHGFMEEADNMRCLAIPYSDSAYESLLVQKQGVALTCAVVHGAVAVMEW